MMKKPMKKLNIDDINIVDTCGPNNKPKTRFFKLKIFTCSRRANFCSWRAKISYKKKMGLNGLKIRLLVQKQYYMTGLNI
jgi:hypothetical protein